MSKRKHSDYLSEFRKRRHIVQHPTIHKGLGAIIHLDSMASRHGKKMHRKHASRRSKGRMASPPIVRLQRSMYDRGYGFPDRIETRLRYDQVGNMTSTVGSIGKQVFRMNSLFDPDFTGAGHQPLYYDQLSAIYNQYAVIKSHITVTFTCKETATVPFIIGLVGDDDGTTAATFSTLQEKSHGRSKVLGLPNGGSNVLTMTDKFNCQKMLTIDPYASETYKTLTSANPAEGWFSQVWCISADGATTQALYYKAEIIYTALFTELTDVTQS